MVIRPKFYDINLEISCDVNLARNIYVLLWLSIASFLMREPL
ncbi:hypothetical protein [Rubritalea tangerina]